MNDRSCKEKYGISKDEYLRMKEVQDDCCYVCGRPGNTLKNGLNLDHNHSTGSLRKFLCPRCNMFVGILENADGLLFMLSLYISDHEK